MSEQTKGAALALVEKSESHAALTVSGGVRINGLSEVFALSARLAKAKGFVPRAYLGDENAIAGAILTGMELGIGPMESMRVIHMIEGKPTLDASYMLARALNAGLRHKWVRTDASVARLKLWRGAAEHEHIFTIEDAKTAGLAGKPVWKSYPAQMLRARCISGALRAFAPDVLGAGIYTREEIADGDVIDATIDAEIVDTQTGEVTAAPKSAAQPAQLAQCKTIDDVLVWTRAKLARDGKVDADRVRKFVTKLMGDAPESERDVIRKLVDDALGVKPQPQREPGEDDDPGSEETALSVLNRGAVGRSMLTAHHEVPPFEDEHGYTPGDQ